MNASGEDLVGIGRFGRPHGVRGEISVMGCTLTADELESVARIVWRGRRGETRPLTLRSVRVHGERLLVTFEGFGDRDAVAVLTNGELAVAREALPEPGPGEAYLFQLIGLRVVDASGRDLGTLADIMDTGAHPIYVIRGEKEMLLPATDEFVQEVDLERGVVTVSPPAGLEDLNP